jgi:Predicted periplasmic lipoprotein (DUF2279)
VWLSSAAMRSARFVAAVLATALLCPRVLPAQPQGEPPGPAAPAADEQGIVPAEPAGTEPPAFPASIGAPEPILPPVSPAPPPAPDVVSAPAAPAAELDTGAAGPARRGSRRGRVISASILGSIYATFSTWAYFAWYRPRKKYDSIQFLNEGWFGPDTYAGGADKLGHMYANYAFVRGAVSVLDAGGWERWPALAISGGLTVGFFTAIEVKDGYHQGFGFSYQDIAANLTGNALAILLMGFPALDRALDVRIEYFPTRQFIDDLIDNGGVDAAEDYTGQAFMLAYHLGSIGPLHRTRYLGWTRYVDVVVGYQARNYKPEPDDPVANPREQELYVGLTLDMQALFRELRKKVPRDSAWGPVVGGVRGAFEFIQLPYTTLDVLDFERDNGPLPMDAAASPLRR